jgi:hypothetical protein
MGLGRLLVGLCAETTRLLGQTSDETRDQTRSSGRALQNKARLKVLLETSFLAKVSGTTGFAQG